MATVIPCRVTSLAGPNLNLGQFSCIVEMVLPDGSLNTIVTNDLPTTATSIQINNEVAAAGIRAYQAWGGTDPLAVSNVVGGAS